MTSFFSDTRPGNTVTYGSATFELPILYFKDDFFGLYFSADYRKVKAIMPSDNLHPLMLPNGRAVVAVAAYNYTDTSIGPYGEIPVGIPVTFNTKKKRLTSLMPLLKESNYPGFGILVMHLPVTKAEARDAGRGEWGYTKFIADMTFRLTPEHYQCTMNEKERLILDLHVPRQGFKQRDRKPLTSYSVKDGNLVKTVIKNQGNRWVSLKPRGAYIKFGDHPVANSILALGIANRPFMGFYYTERSGVLPSGEVIETGVRPFDGYMGEDREALYEIFHTDGDL